MRPIIKHRSTVILKVGILIKTDADFYNGIVEKTKDTRAKTIGRAAAAWRGARPVPIASTY